MKTITENQLLSDISSGNFDSIYLFSGIEVLKKNEIIKLIKNRYENTEIITHYAKEVDINLLISDLSSSSMFSNKKLVVLKDYQNIKKEIEKILLSYFEKPEFENLLIIFLDEEVKDVDLEKKFGRCKISHIKINPPGEEEIREYITKEFKKHQKEIDEASILYLSQSINSYGMLVNETEKLLTFLKDKKSIDISKTILLTSDFKETNRFEIIKAILSKDKSSLLAITEKLISDMENPNIILNSFEIALEKLLKIIALKKSNIKDQAISYSIGIFKSEMYTPIEIKNETHVLNAINYCLEIEQKLKTSTSYNPYLLIRNAVYVISRLMSF